MRTILTILTLSTLAHLPLAGQGSTVLTEPLVVPRAPEFSAWVARCTYGAAASELSAAAVEGPEGVNMTAQAQPGGAAKRPEWASRSVIKTGDVRCEIDLFTNGDRLERWQTGATCVSPRTVGGRLFLKTQEPVREARDFLEFDWVSQGNFKGIKTFNGRRCLVFEDRVETAQILDPREFALVGPSGAPDEMLITAQAAIDAETRLPVGLILGNQKWTYEMQAPPTATLTVPAAFAKVIAEVKARQEARNRPLSKP